MVKSHLSYDPCPVCGGEMLTEGHKDEPTQTWHMRDFCTVCDFEGLYIEPIDDPQEAADG